MLSHRGLSGGHKAAPSSALSITQAPGTPFEASEGGAAISEARDPSHDNSVESNFGAFLTGGGGLLPWRKSPPPPPPQNEECVEGCLGSSRVVEGCRGLLGACPLIGYALVLQSGNPWQTGNAHVAWPVPATACSRGLLRLLRSRGLNRELLCLGAGFWVSVLMYGTQMSRVGSASLHTGEPVGLLVFEVKSLD